MNEFWIVMVRMSATSDWIPMFSTTSTCRESAIGLYKRSYDGFAGKVVKGLAKVQKVRLVEVEE